MRTDHEGPLQGSPSNEFHVWKDFDSWEKFKSFVSQDLIDKSHPIQDRYLFRGQGDADWPLQSSFERKFKTLPGPVLPDRHQLLLKYFKQQIQYFPEYRRALENDQDDRVCLALAQHHGLPTRLLDWTDSPYIAAYFALRGHLEKDHGTNQDGKTKTVAIWILDKHEKHFWGEGTDVDIIFPPAWQNERQKRQYGWFTHSKTPYRTLEQYVLSVDEKQTALRKVTFSAKVARLAISDLDLMRINARELFADLNGAATDALLRAVLADE